MMSPSIRRLDALVNNAGILTPGAHLPLSEQMRLSFDTNTIGPAVMVEKFNDLLEKSTHAVRIVNVSSSVGSINLRLSDTTSFMYKAKGIQYRASKAALNMVTADQHVFGIEKGWKVFAYCPGWTVSNFHPNNTAANGAQPVEDAIKPLMDLLNGKKDDQSGSFFNSKEAEYPW